MENVFKKQGTKLLFIGEKLQCFIPKRYENRGLMTIKESVQTLGIFEMGIYGKDLTKVHYTGLLLPAIISTYPNEIKSTVHRDVECYVLEYCKNQIFLNELTFIKQDNLPYAIFREYIYLGNFPKFIDYNNSAFLFDEISKTTGLYINIDHAIMEMLYSHQFRSQDDTSVKHRHSKMNKPPVFIELKSISEGPDSTSSKLYGSYFNDGLNSALTTKSKHQSELENLLRE